MRLHVVGLPHTETTSGYPTCAYTQKLVKFGRMMTGHGYDVLVYAGADNEAVCAEHVPLVSRAERVRWFGEHDQNGLWGNLTWNPADEPWQVMNARAILAIGERAEPNDLICLSAGLAQKPIADSIADSLPYLTVCEPFVGYEGIFSDFCAFESHAWRHFLYGKYGWSEGRWYDTVIPNYFDRDDFLEPDGKDDYLLFVGRVTLPKNPHVAAQIAERAGMRLVVAGPGVTHVEPGRIHADHCTLEGDVEYVGPVGIEERARLMSRARALIVPSRFVEPFGGVAVEAMMSGTPVVAAPYGAFTETVAEGVSGYRFNTLNEGVDAVTNAVQLDPQTVRAYALERYSLEAVGPQFHEWFRRLGGLRGGELGDWYGNVSEAALVA